MSTSTTSANTNPRQNRLIHGLSAKEPKTLPPNLQLRVDTLFHQFTIEYKPKSNTEIELIQRLALAAARLERIADLDIQSTSVRIQTAQDDYIQAQSKATLAHIQNLQTNPALASYELTQSTTGCDWLLEQWKSLQSTLHTLGAWSPAQAALARQLWANPFLFNPQDNTLSIHDRHILTYTALHKPIQPSAYAHFGFDPKARPLNDPVEKLFLDFLQAQEATMGPEFEPSSSLADYKPTVLALLDQSINQTIQTLELLRAEALERDQTQLDLAPTLAQINTSKEAQILLRYQARDSLDFNRAINQLRHIQTQRQKQAKPNPQQHPEPPPFPPQKHNPTNQTHPPQPQPNQPLPSTFPINNPLECGGSPPLHKPPQITAKHDRTLSSPAQPLSKTTRQTTTSPRAERPPQSRKHQTGLPQQPQPPLEYEASPGCAVPSIGSSDPVPPAI
jgi:hypothetical protein